MPGSDANRSRRRRLLSRSRKSKLTMRTPRVLRDLLVASPALVAAMTDLLATGALRERTEARLLQALELGATAACQEALAVVATDLRGNDVRRWHCLRALGNVPAPTPATMQLLWSTFASSDGETARVAVLAFGRAAGVLRGRENAGYDDARAQLQRALQLAAAPEAVAVALQAMASTGDAAFAPAIAPHLGDAAPAVRSAAAQALATVGGQAAAAQLIAAFAVERDPTTRRSLARLLSLSGVDAPGSAALTSLLQQELDERVRGYLAVCLARG
jgi:HEAT repeat protein